MSSSYAIIYDGIGTNARCLDATEKSLRELVDGRYVNTQRQSMICSDFGTHETPVSLLVVPGGNYRKMESELCLSKTKIQQLVKEHGARFFGICAGAIAASSGFFTTSSISIGTNEDVRINPYRHSQEAAFLELYSGKTCALRASETSRFFGTCKVRREGTDEGYHHFFQDGVCFNVGRGKKVEILSRYEEYSITGKIFDITGQKSKKFHPVVPIASVTEKVGNGRVLLTGFHPEMDSTTLNQMSIQDQAPSFVKEEFREKLNRTVRTLQANKADREVTMLDYLTRLEIPTKKTQLQK